MDIPKISIAITGHRSFRVGEILARKEVAVARQQLEPFERCVTDSQEFMVGRKQIEKGIIL